jgi:peptidoglycan/LPS O-acetylase OafA/YrhL
MIKRNYLIDLLRFFAASWVALFHFNKTVRFIDNWYRDFLKVGYLGVPVFFVISGYCIYLAAENSLTIKDFLIRRFFRIFPAYWASILVVLVVVIILIVATGHNSVTVLPKTIASVLATLLLLTTPFSHVQIINWVYWTLPYEILFYIIISFTIILPTRLRVWWLILVSLLTFIVPVQYEGPLFFFTQWPAFCLGALVYRFLHFPKTEIIQNLFLFALVVAGIFIIYNAHYYPYACLITATLIIINHFKPLQNNFGSRLGDYSYSIYLLHIPLFYLFGFVKQNEAVQSTLWINICWDLTLLTIIIFFSKYMYLYIELPAIKMGKKIAQKYRTVLSAN